MVTRISHVAIEVPDLDEAIAFYTGFIGLREVERRGDTVYLSANVRHHELVLARSGAGRAGLLHVGLEVAAGTLGTCVAQALDAGAEHARELDEPGVGQAVLVHAPQGFAIEIFEGMKTVEVPPIAGAIVPERFGHFNLGMPDIDRWSQFLQEGLGFRRSDRAHDAEGTVITWYHCPVLGADHHGIANTRSPTARLHHIKWEYPDLAQVVELVDRYGDSQRRLVWGMGRHGVDRSIFAYVEDPGGLMNELGIGMLKVDDSRHWSAPSDYPIDDPHAGDLWGSAVPQPWLEHGIPLADPPVAASA